MPPGGKSWIEASKNAMNHFFYRLVWLRCFLGYPAKALENRKTEVIKLLVDGITRRGKWRKDLEELEKGIDKWFGSQAAAKCVSIEQAALLLPPESWSSSALHRRAEEHGDTSSLSPRLKQQAQVQDLAAWCKIQRHALQNDQVRIKNVLRWLNDEIKWWEGQLNVVKLLHVFRDEHASTPEQVVEFERRLDIVVRQAMSRDGVSPA
ncbi:hypothetical protein QBC46DRAFT_396551 [Diplogelasinospora grovesii]|uniref:Uncharacterized protein n=1 Tax=Diplogelasinospora grovesii TaxID=303347 RepID=A0AAN6MZ77_9PEZI|nr:hypothetical protein QBC46DRAFT_396551 [Diplogelasinospora grovesii]